MMHTKPKASCWNHPSVHNAVRYFIKDAGSGYKFRKMRIVRSAQPAIVSMTTSQQDF